MGDHVYLSLESMVKSENRTRRDESRTHDLEVRQLVGFVDGLELCQSLDVEIPGSLVR